MDVVDIVNKVIKKYPQIHDKQLHWQIDFGALQLLDNGLED